MNREDLAREIVKTAKMIVGAWIGNFMKFDKAAFMKALIEEIKNNNRNSAFVIIPDEHLINFTVTIDEIEYSVSVGVGVEADVGEIRVNVAAARAARTADRHIERDDEFFDTHENTVEDVATLVQKTINRAARR